MKIEQLIVQHLYKNKSVTLQGIGTIHLNPSVIIPTGNEKDFVMPENAFTFEYNLKAPEDETLIDFIVQQTRKIKPLASSDLESYSILAKQFLNIGKPLEIHGVGTIQKNQEGFYEFIQGNFIPAKIEEIPKQITEKAEEPISFEHQSTKNNNKKYFLALLGVIAVGLVGAALYYFLFYNKPVVTESTQEPVTQTNAAVDTVKTDTIAQINTDTSNKVTPTPIAVKTDSNNFKIVIKEYKNEIAANKAFARMRKYSQRLVLIKKIQLLTR